MRARSALAFTCVLAACTTRERQRDTADGAPSMTGAVHVASSATSECPAEELIEELHAASFHFQHGPLELAREHLNRARAAFKSPSDATSHKLLEQLSEISRRAESDPDWRAAQTEIVRLELGEWSCLPTSTHDRFHTKLPPLR